MAHPFVRLALAWVLMGMVVAPVEAFTVDASRIAMWRNFQGPNDVGRAEGDTFFYEANVSPTSLGVFVDAVSATGFDAGKTPCAPQAINPTLCFTSTAYNANYLDPWTLTFSQGNAAVSLVAPTLRGAESRVPLLTSVALSGASLTPTITWKVPGGLVPDGYRVLVFDKSKLTNVGVPDVILSKDFSGQAESFTLPATFPGSGASLLPGGNYVLGISPVITRGHVDFVTHDVDSNILNRSTTYVDFSPLPSNFQAPVYMPTISNGIFHFAIQDIEVGKTFYLDPEFATSFEYRSATGSPAFASVLLPNVGDGVFTVAYLKDEIRTSATALQGQAFFFGGAGVTEFTVSGIEASAHVDPTNPSAFITGVTFSGAGTFVGTMTAVDEPSTAVLSVVGLSTILLRRRIKKTAARTCFDR